MKEQSTPTPAQLMRIKRTGQSRVVVEIEDVYSAKMVKVNLPASCATTLHELTFAISRATNDQFNLANTRATRKQFDEFRRSVVGFAFDLSEGPVTFDFELSAPTPPEQTQPATPQETPRLSASVLRLIDESFQRSGRFSRGSTMTAARRQELLACTELGKQILSGETK